MKTSILWEGFKLAVAVFGVACIALLVTGNEGEIDVLFGPLAFTGILSISLLAVAIYRRKKKK